MLDSKAIEQGEKFEQIAREILSLVKSMESVLKKHEVSCIASLCMDVKSGYFSFSTHENKWEMVRSGYGYPEKLRYDFSEELALEDRKEERRE